MVELLAGAAAVDMTPVVGVMMDGYGARRDPSANIHDPLFARVLVLDYGGGGAAALVGCDLLGMHPWIVAEVRRRALDAPGITRDAVMVAATHNHAGPTGLRAGMFARLDEARAEEVVSQIVSGINAAWSARLPASLKVGAAPVETVSMNRRDPEGPTDKSLRVVLLDSDDGPIACLLNYSCHATVLNGANLELSAEFPGVACRVVEQATGATAVYLNGACGDVNPAWIEQDFASVERAGKAIGGTAVRVIADLQAAGRGLRSHNIRWDEFLPLDSPGRLVEPRFDCARVPVDLPMREFAADEEYDERIEHARADTGRCSEGSVALREAAASLSRWNGEKWAALWSRRSGEGATRRTELQAIRLGASLVLLSLPGEFFAETAAGIRAESGIDDLLIAGYANDYVGYVVPKEAYEEGGYETGVTFFAPASEAIIKRTAVNMLKQLQA